MRLIYFFIFLLSVLLLVSCASTDELEVSPADLVRIKPRINIVKVWSNNSLGSAEDINLALTPVHVNGIIYSADAKGRVQALDASNGRRLWKIESGENITGGLGHGQNTLLAGTRNGRVFALNQSDGALVWSTVLSSEVLVAPASSDGVVVVRTSDGRIYGLDENNGNRLWVYESSVPPLTLRGNGAPLIDHGQIFVGFSNGKLTAITLNEGKWLWDVAVAVSEGRSELQRIVDVDADPVIKDGIVYAVAYQGRLVAVSAATGRIIWTRDMSSNTDISIGDDMIYVSSDNSDVWAVDRRTGAVMWKQDKLHARSVTGPVIYKDYIIAGDFEGYLHWMSQADGSFVGRYRVDDVAIMVTPDVVNDIIYVKDQAGRIVALQADAI